MDVPEAKSGDEYRYLIVSGDRKFCWIGPCARCGTHSAGNGVICQRKRFSQKGVNPTAWNERSAPSGMPPLAKARRKERVTVFG